RAYPKPGLDRAPTRRSATKHHPREHRGRDEPEAGVEADDRASRAGLIAGGADEPRERDTFDECGERSERVERPRLLALAHRATGERHPALAEAPVPVPDEADDHCGDGCDDDRDPAHV